MIYSKTHARIVVHTWSIIYMKINELVLYQIQCQTVVGQVLFLIVDKV